MERYIIACSKYIPKGGELLEEWLYVSHVRKCGIINLTKDKEKARKFSNKSADEAAMKLGRFYGKVLIIHLMDEGERSIK